MNRLRNHKGFTIIELLIVVIVIGILAAAGLAKYQNFAETSRRKTCLGQIQTIENAVGVWETTNTCFAENAKVAFGFTTRTGQLTGTAISTGSLGIGGTIAAITDNTSQATSTPPANFANVAFGVGPLNSVIRDDKVWICPSALSRYYNSEIQNVDDSYLDTMGSGVNPTTRGGTAIGVGGRYLCAIAGRGNTNAGQTPICNGGFPTNWIVNGSTNGTSNTLSPAPQSPFKLVICGCYGSFGPNTSTNPNLTGNTAINSGGPVGPDNSTLNRHSSRW